MIMLTGSADTPSVMDINTSSIKPPIRIENATHSGLKHPCDHDSRQDNAFTESTQEMRNQSLCFRPTYSFTLFLSIAGINPPNPVICLFQNAENAASQSCNIPCLFVSSDKKTEILLTIGLVSGGGTLTATTLHKQTNVRTNKGESRVSSH